MTWSAIVSFEIAAEMHAYAEHERDEFEQRQHAAELERRRAKTEHETAERAFRRKVDPDYRAAHNARQAAEKRRRYQTDPVYREAKKAAQRARHAAKRRAA